MIQLPQEHIYLGRQPILDREQSVFAYELLFRSGQSAVSNVTDNLLASATVIINTISQIGIDNVLDGHYGFINVSYDLLMSDMLELLPSERMVLELLETVPIDDRAIARCRELKSKGFTLAIDDYRYQPGYDALFEIVDYIKFDLMASPPEQVTAAVQQLKRWPKLRFLAEKVEDRDQFAYFHKLGFALFQGYFFAKPMIISGRKTSPDQTVLMRVLGQLLSDVEIEEIERSFKESPNLGLSLLRLVNSVGMGLQSKIGSLRQALVVLGRRQLMRWVQLLLYSQGSAETSSPLMAMAAVRAKTMELLCDVHPEARMRQDDMRDRAFMTGVLSLVDVVLGMEKAQILDQLNLADDVKQALLQHEGFLGHMLLLMERMESGEFDAVATLLNQLRLTPQELHRAQIEAMGWASSLGKPTE